MRTKWIGLVAIGCLAVAATHGPSRALADRGEQPHAMRERLRGLSGNELKRLQPHLSVGPVALVEFADTDADRLPAINVATYVYAPVSTVVKVIEHPERYPSFIGTADNVDVISRDRSAVVYDWDWSMAIFRMHGRNVMRSYLPRAGQASRGARITIDSQSGDMGKGRTSIRVLPRNIPARAGQPAVTRSLIVLSTRVDLREANYVARQLSRAARSINRSANISFAYSMLLGYQSEAERLSGGSAPTRPDTGFAKPKVNTRTLWPLLRRGDLLFLDIDDDGALRQVTVVGGIGKPPKIVREVLLDAHGFGRSLLPGSNATVVSQSAGTTIFDWDIDLPLIGLSGRMRMDEQPDVIAVRATRGALLGGRWSFSVEPVGKRASIVVSWARFDLRKTSWWLKRLVANDPVLAHGISAASEVMLIRALRSRSRKHGKLAQNDPKPRKVRRPLKTELRRNPRFGR